MYVYIHTYIYTRTHTHIHTCVYIYVYVYMYTHTHTHIHIYIKDWRSVGVGNSFCHVREGEGGKERESKGAKAGKGVCV